HVTPACKSGGTRHPSAAVLDLDADIRALAQHANDRVPAAGMTVNVRECLLNDSKDSNFGVSRKSAKFLVHLEIRLNAAALGEASRVPVQGGVESTFIEQRRVHEVRDRSQLADDFVGNIRRRPQEIARSLARFRNQAPDATEHHLDRGHALDSSLVEIACDAPLFGVASVEQLLRKTSQFVLALRAIGNVFGGAKHAQRFSHAAVRWPRSRVQDADTSVVQFRAHYRLDRITWHRGGRSFASEL